MNYLEIIGYHLEFEVLYLHYNIFMDNSEHHVEKNNYASADTYLHSAVPKNEFQMNFRPNRKKYIQKKFWEDICTILV